MVIPKTLKTPLSTLLLIFLCLPASRSFSQLPESFEESFETVPLGASWTLTNQGGGSASVSDEKAHTGSRALKLAIGTHSGGHGGSKTSARLDFGAPLATGVVEAYIYNDSSAPYYIFPMLVDEAHQLLLGAWYPDHTNLISAYVPAGETMDETSQVLKKTGWSLFRWEIEDGYCRFLIDGKLCARGMLRTSPRGLSIAFDTYFRSNHAIWVDSVKVVRTGPIDTDGDGVNDFREGKDGTDPNDPASFNPLSKNLIAFYNFDQNLADESGYGKDLDQWGDHEFVADLTKNSGQALRSPSRVSGGVMSSKKSGVSGNSPRTISFWFRSDGPQPWPAGNVVLLGSRVAIDRGRGTIQIDNGYRNVETPSLEFLHQRVNHFVWTYQNKLGDSRFYVNGQRVESVYEDGFGDLETTLEGVPDGPIKIMGGPQDIGFGDRGFRGEVDNVRLYDRALTEAEAQQLYVTEAGDLDSDGDGLTDAWERGYGRYQVIQGKFSWEQAKLDAHARGGHLATVTSPEEWAFLRGVLSAFPSDTFWLGGTDAEQEGVWRWITGELWTFSSWIQGQPDNSGGEPYASVAVDADGKVNDWNDLGATFRGERVSYVLEFGYPTDPFKADTDGDGFDDKVETDSGTDPNNPASKPGLPSLRIEEPAGKGLANNAKAKTFDNWLEGTSSVGRVYTIRNTGAGPLTSIALAKVGPHASDFTVTGPDTTTLAPGASTTFSVFFAPTTGGTRRAQISIASNDANRNPFLINLSGFGIGFNVDSDQDGLSDAAEYLLKMYASNFDWQTKQPELVGLLFSNLNPAGFFTKAQYDSNFASGRTAGRADVTNNPSAYKLVSRTNIPPVRVALPKGTAFSVNLGGSWTRYAQSGAPAGWSFNTNTGILSGVTPTKLERSVRVTPYNGSQAGPQMTIQLGPRP